MQTVWDIIYLRRPVLNYVSPPICEVIFSGSSTPVIILSDRLIGKVTGLALGGFGGFELTWNAFPGALCYNVYFIGGDNVAVILAQCVDDTSFVLPPNGPGEIVVTPITLDGEGEPSDPIPYPVGGGGGSTINVTTTCSLASRDTFPAIFTIARAPGDTVGNVTVFYTLGGTAVNGVDYNATPTSVVIPNGQDAVDVNITVIEVVLVSDKTVTLTLSPSLTYAVGPSNTATVGIRPPVVRIKDYGTLQPLLIPHSNTPDSVYCEWDGTFNLVEGPFPSGESVYYYTDFNGTKIFPNASIGGKQLWQTFGAGPYSVGVKWQVGVFTKDSGGGIQHVLTATKNDGDTAAGTYICNVGLASDPRPTIELELFP